MATPQSKTRLVVPLLVMLVIAGLVTAWLVVERVSPRPAVIDAVVPVVPSVVEGPRFDVVRVGPQGQAVVAGQAAPGAEVIVRNGGAEVARTRADAQGAFVALPSEPLQPGGQELTLASRVPGAAEVAGGGSVVMNVPAREAAAGPVAALLVPAAGAPLVLRDGGAVAAGPITLDRVDYDEAGAVRFTGAARVGAAVRLYIDNSGVGDVRADAQGRWVLTPGGVVAPGLHSVRADVVDAGGRVVSRVEMPFERALADGAVADGRVVVQPGETLWRLARAAYGRGMRYSVIYLANRGQIRDPNRIYPGQTFAVPNGAQ